MADLSSSPPARTKPEPTDSLSPKPSVELHRRSKTGCRTCRRRKKKCDEARPGSPMKMDESYDSVEECQEEPFKCQNCAKNNILCDGYELRKPWRRGSRNRSSALVVPELPHIINAIDDPMDSNLLSYFLSHSSHELNIYSEDRNPFDELVIDMAISHAGLMHSLLCLSASCLVARRSDSAREVVVRQRHHFDRAVVTLRKDVEVYESNQLTDNADCIMLQTILLCLESVVTGEAQGSYRCHLLATQRLVENCRDLSYDVQTFARQFLLYHNLANSVSCLNPVNDLWLSIKGDGNEPTELASSLNGVSNVTHGLLGPMSCTRRVRDGVRYCRATGDPRWYRHELLLSLALDVEAHLRVWKSRLSAGTPQYWASLAYRQSAYVYLYRTIKPSIASPDLAQVVSEGLSYMSLALQDSLESQCSWVRGILLPPLFLLGCGAFEPSQRLLVIESLENLHACTPWANIMQARAVLEELWSRMDAEHGAENAWDWEAVMKDMNLDALLS